MDDVDKKHDIDLGDKSTHLGHSSSQQKERDDIEDRIENLGFFLMFEWCYSLIQVDFSLCFLSYFPIPKWINKMR